MQGTLVTEGEFVFGVWSRFTGKLRWSGLCGFCGSEQEVSREFWA
jgi:hypothetical protein